jgi:hypothetical protein
VWVPVIRFMSCDLRVLMDQPTESVLSHHPSRRREDRWFGGPERGGLRQGPVWAVAVVMIDVLGPTPSAAVGSRRSASGPAAPAGRCPPTARRRRWPAVPHRRTQHPDTLGSEDRVERGDELGIPIPDEQPELADAVAGEETASFAHTVLVDFRARRRASADPHRIFRVTCQLARQLGLVGVKRVLDSAPLEDAVATQDTVTMLRRAIRGLLGACPPALKAKVRAA